MPGVDSPLYRDRHSAACMMLILVVRVPQSNRATIQVQLAFIAGGHVVTNIRQENGKKLPYFGMPGEFRCRSACVGDSLHLP
jgi:hypothetical protein